ncbi:DUF6477 family protein [Shimia biformata]|uniref:DUF6477 family protein n=1 Tax=Shimia biformata TaxID=1294299 RepID=UPI00194E162C|nr:DUF6477 family protein [Shimia biformata]
MQDILSQLSNLRRPRLLIRAARLGADDYLRDRHLRRHLGTAKLPRHGEAIMQLMQIESALNDMRHEGDAGYSLVRHVDVMIALMGEARLLRAAQTV